MQHQFIQECQNKNIEGVKSLLNHVKDVNMKTHHNKYPLTTAISNGYNYLNERDITLFNSYSKMTTDVVSLLISAGAHVNYNYIKYGEDPLTEACKMINLPCMKLLLEHGADSHKRYVSTYNNPLWFLINHYKYYGRYKLEYYNYISSQLLLMIEILINDGAYVNKIYSMSGCLLSFAIRFGLIEIVQMLLDAGAYINDDWFIESNKNSPITIARNNGEAHIDEIIVLLRKYQSEQSIVIRTTVDDIIYIDIAKDLKYSVQMTLENNTINYGYINDNIIQQFIDSYLFPVEARYFSGVKKLVIPYIFVNHIYERLEIYCVQQHLHSVPSKDDLLKTLKNNKLRFSEDNKRIMGYHMKGDLYRYYYDN